MNELNRNEFLFLKIIDNNLGLGSDDGVNIKDSLNELYSREPILYFEIRDDIISNLIGKETIVISPDGTRFKLSDYGAQLFRKKIKEEKEWVNQGPFIKLNPQKKEEIDIKEGEHFKGYWEIVSLMKRAKKSIKIQDPYIGTDTIAMLNELDEGVEIQILTTDKNWKHKDFALVGFEKLRKQRKGKTELKIHGNVHSRRLIVDDLEVYSSDDSFKDIGLHNASKIKKLEKTEEEIGNYIECWKEAKPLT